MERIVYHPSGDTIAAVSTPQAPGAIGIVRISGPRAREVAGRVFVSAHGKSLDGIRGYTALYGKVRDAGGDIDEAIALNFRAPASFTGEDVVELSCHGGLYVMRRLLKAVLEAGAVAAGPGEFTRRAFLNGKMGLTEAESVMQMVCAQGEQAAKTALAGRGGILERRIRAVRDRLTGAAAHLAAWADYPEDDIPQVTGEELDGALTATKSDLETLLRQFEAGRAIREGVETAIAGRPNVGKSTLMNLLAGCERSIVTQYAGTTRDVVEDTVVLGGVPLRLADTAGIRRTENPVESIGVDRAQRKIRTAQLVLAVFDGSQELDADDRMLLDELAGTPCIAVVNKSDLPQKINLKYIKSKIKRIVIISAVSGTGLDELRDAVQDVLETAKLDPSQGILFTERQRDAARRALDCVNEALDALKSGMTFDAVTVSIEAAVQVLLELTGERATEAVVDSVFRHFCVGK
ncbi:MAG: tRNA uridine-5-carboxymethylaminomethyl(34) synthesis GTPase MnmE [Oscillospiraceae bacterium]|jgi:tRNA modification GTPase|nr:tRNA uridine-5-carboxymethylaminomethyl(34) synthesis GTPase MnmE [Oscillospiraceae bacterium]MCI1989876.1 tRNA uridine-5-carboxymethylaminomethyl(34) synthesis GTPase MnmE [Oscillospiraceae bacterium]MCI2034899.1 tRNA uridine-5-carboxymethylaminomethyl(34) synthesis GTPase MnmE [Oscillospiraceae bacterium]